jgi:hypothetical protein
VGVLYKEIFIIIWLIHFTCKELLNSLLHTLKLQWIESKLYWIFNRTICTIGKPYCKSSHVCTHSKMHKHSLALHFKLYFLHRRANRKDPEWKIWTPLNSLQKLREDNWKRDCRRSSRHSSPGNAHLHLKGISAFRQYERRRL